MADPSLAQLQATSPKYIIVTGGTLSGLGKGTAVSSLGVVLRSHGIRVTSMKIDPYLNVDAGTMSPFEHGECFVLDDGAEADLDLGNYERFLDLQLNGKHSMTTGKVYSDVLSRERQGDYLGKTVQIVPHVTDAVQEWIMSVAREPADGTALPPEICLIELGGTVGDIESAMYLEALQQLGFRVGIENFLCIHLGFVPYMDTTGEQKTKPCQHSVKVMREAGLKPDLLFCRSSQPVTAELRQKLSLFCQVRPEEVISLHDVSNVFQVPVLLAEQKVGEVILKRLGLSTDRKVPVLKSISIYGSEDSTQVRLADWKAYANRVDELEAKCRIAIVGKYTGLKDSYMSVIKALEHAGIEGGVHIDLQWIASEHLEENMRTVDQKTYEEAWASLHSVSGVLVPGGFGGRGIEGMIATAKYCRESKTPYFGICAGLQIAVIEASRNLLGLTNANSSEWNDSTPHEVVMFMPEGNSTMKGGTMRLGSRCTIMSKPQSLASRIYGGLPVIWERHRHRYEVNPKYIGGLEQQGMIFSGRDEMGKRMEIFELTDHPFYFGVQYHPEFKSRPQRPSPCFSAFVLASSGLLEKRMNGGNLNIGEGFKQKVMTVGYKDEL